jgi:hypothetical protein
MARLFRGPIRTLSPAQREAAALDRMRFGSFAPPRRAITPSGSLPARSAWMPLMAPRPIPLEALIPPRPIYTVDVSDRPGPAPPASATLDTELETPPAPRPCPGTLLAG